MHQTLIQCTALISAVTLTTLGAPTATYQTHDSSLLVEVAESINSEKISKKTFKMQYTSSLFDLYLIENPINMQSDNIDEISNCKMPEIGYISEYDFNLLCQLVAAEAENQCFEGKRAVVGVVLNDRNTAGLLKLESRERYSRKEHSHAFQTGVFLLRPNM